jgi:hypothetical protein
MIERRMRNRYLPWPVSVNRLVNAGQPDLKSLSNKNFSEEELKEFENLNTAWQSKGAREHD